MKQPDYVYSEPICPKPPKDRQLGATRGVDPAERRFGVCSAGGKKNP